jgi:hypothetical protein
MLNAYDLQRIHIDQVTFSKTFVISTRETFSNNVLNSTSKKNALEEKKCFENVLFEKP